jgi:hypothetical protein
MEKPQTSTSGMESQSHWSASRLLDSIRRFFSTPTSPKVDHLAVALELLKAQHATLDRIVTAKFDVPVHSRITEQRKSEPSFPEYMMSDVLGAESDAEFFEAAEKLTQ